MRTSRNFLYACRTASYLARAAAQAHSSPASLILTVLVCPLRVYSGGRVDPTDLSRWDGRVGGWASVHVQREEHVCVYPGPGAVVRACVRACGCVGVWAAGVEGEGVDLIGGERT